MEIRRASMRSSHRSGRLEDYQLADEVPSLTSAATAAAAKQAASLSADTTEPAEPVVPESAPPEWPTEAVTVAAGVKKVIPQPDYVSLARIGLKPSL